MFSETLSITLRILMLRAGPQEFPYSTTLTPIVTGIALLMSYLQFYLTLPAVRAAVHAAASLAVLAGFVFVLLQARGQVNRAQQTINSIFATGSALTVLLLPPLSAMAPQLALIAENPDLAERQPLPALPTLLVLGVSLWHFLVTAHIFRHALDTRLSLGAVVALLALIVNLVLSSVLTSLFPA